MRLWVKKYFIQYLVRLHEAWSSIFFGLLDLLLVFINNCLTGFSFYLFTWLLDLLSSLFSCFLLLLLHSWFLVKDGVLCWLLLDLLSILNPRLIWKETLEKKILSIRIASLPGSTSELSFSSFRSSSGGRIIWVCKWKHEICCHTYYSLYLQFHPHSDVWTNWTWPQPP